MKVAIIGATSFVGENLILHLQKSKFNIVATYNSNKKIKKEKKNYLEKIRYKKRKKKLF